MKRTLFDKIWDNHIVKEIENGPSILYIDTHYIHEVTSPQAFAELERREIKLFAPKQTFATCDHTIPTIGQHLPIKDPIAKAQIEQLESNVKRHGVTYFPPGDPSNGIVHIIGPELGITQPGMTIVCGDSHTSTHGAFGTIAFGIGSSEVAMVMATQTILQFKPKQMLIEIEGRLQPGVVAKDLILYIISKLGASAGRGFFIQFAGETIEQMSMEGRMTLCNMTIEMGARGGLIAPDKTTFDYLESRGVSYSKKWENLKSDSDAKYDSIFKIDATQVVPMITWGTTPAMAISIDGTIESAKFGKEADKALSYMGFREGEKLLGKSVDYLFLGSCTNGRIEDFRAFAGIVKGRKKADAIVAWLVPGSKRVEREIEEEGIGEILREAGFEIREPGCSACLAMNDDKVPSGCYSLSTTNRNFEGRQGAGARTLLVGPLVAAAAAITGVITDPRELI